MTTVLCNSTAPFAEGAALVACRQTGRYTVGWLVPRPLSPNPLQSSSVDRNSNLELEPRSFQAHNYFFSTTVTVVVVSQVHSHAHHLVYNTMGARLGCS